MPDAGLPGPTPPDARASPGYLYLASPGYLYLASSDALASPDYDGLPPDARLGMTTTRNVP